MKVYIISQKGMELLKEYEQEVRGLSAKFPNPLLESVNLKIQDLKAEIDTAGLTLVKKTRRR